jgi:ribose 1,5-bisphosphokinase PhnN
LRLCVRGQLVHLVNAVGAGGEQVRAVLYRAEPQRERLVVVPRVIRAF